MDGWTLADFGRLVEQDGWARDEWDIAISRQSSVVSPWSSAGTSLCALSTCSRSAERDIGFWRGRMTEGPFSVLSSQLWLRASSEFSSEDA